ncbi:hypothetical protein U5A82_15350 [Sphingobium sp. CR2-8]|uniref:hypothetical protein n=1 Tax=Sphingobium sp. CR2-8 TaxID=1306534 RepID=UPI002DB58618|nr:hypothetical protein [Sphingobium sp. CR2-8]MEC3911794.1 hypothetical protein [Sphingobium sp. CR2-8]
MFTLVAATLFSAAFLLSMGTIVWMFAHYHDKMVAALQFEPIPQNVPVYRLRIRRTRAPQSTRPAPRIIPGSALAA